MVPQFTHLQSVLGPSPSLTMSVKAVTVSWCKPNLIEPLIEVTGIVPVIILLPSFNVRTNLQRLVPKSEVTQILLIQDPPV